MRRSLGHFFMLCLSLFLGWVGGIGADWPSVGARECWGRTDEQGAGLWWLVQQGTAKWYLLKTETSASVFITAGIWFWLEIRTNPFMLCKVYIPLFWGLCPFKYVTFPSLSVFCEISEMTRLNTGLVLAYNKSLLCYFIFLQDVWEIQWIFANWNASILVCSCLP